MHAWVKRHMLGLVVAMVAACGGTQPTRGTGEVVVTERVSPNYTVFVIEDADGVRRLRFERDGVDQSAVVMGDPEQLIFAYTRGLTAAFALRPDPERVLIVGLGGGTLPMFLRKHLPNVHIDVVEIDPIVLEVAKADLDFKEDAHLVVHIADGRKFIEESKQRWDVIVLDAYGAEEIPGHLITKPFYAAVRERLEAGGLMAANVWSEHANPKYKSMLRTMEAVFPEVHVVAPQKSESRIVLALAGSEHLTREDIATRAGVLKREWKLRFDLARMVRLGHAGPDDLLPGGSVIED